MVLLVDLALALFVLVGTFTLAVVAFSFLKEAKKMTKSKYLIALMLAVACVACNDGPSKEDAEKQARIELQLEKLAKEKEEARNRESSQQDNDSHGYPADEDEPSEPEPQATPEAPSTVEQFTLYSFGSTTVNADCLCRDETACGMTFSQCKNHRVYRCMTNVIYTAGETLETEENKGACN